MMGMLPNNCPHCWENPCVCGKWGKEIGKLCTPASAAEIKAYEEWKKDYAIRKSEGRLTEKEKFSAGLTTDMYKHSLKAVHQ